MVFFGFFLDQSNRSTEPLTTFIVALKWYDPRLQSIVRDSHCSSWLEESNFDGQTNFFLSHKSVLMLLLSLNLLVLSHLGKTE